MSERGVTASPEYILLKVEALKENPPPLTLFPELVVQFGTDVFLKVINVQAPVV